MRLILTFAILAAPVLAAAAPPDLKELERSIDVFTRCSKIADEISAMKVPEGQAEARAQKALETHPESKGVKVAVKDEHQRFMDSIEEKVKRLDACGAEYEVAAKESYERLEKLREEHISQEDGKAITPLVLKYHASKEQLQKSITGLSQDFQIQSYVSRTLVDHFLKEHRQDHPNDWHKKMIEARKVK